MSIERQISAHILKHLVGSTTVREASRSACWEAVREAREKGWSAELIAGLMGDYMCAGVAMLEAQRDAELAMVEGLLDEAPMPWKPMGPPPVWEM